MSFLLRSADLERMLCPSFIVNPRGENEDRCPKLTPLLLPRDGTGNGIKTKVGTGIGIRTGIGMGIGNVNPTGDGDLNLNV